METTKILFAVLFGVSGFWIFTQLGNQEARHILVSNTAAHVMDNGVVAMTFSMENTGAPDRIVSASSRDGDVTLSQPDGIVIPGGSSALSLESAHLVMENAPDPLASGTLLSVTLTLEDAGTVSAFVRVADTQTAPMLHGTMIHGAMDIDMGDPEPTLSVQAQKTDAGWQIRLDTTDFRFNAGSVDGPHVPGEGHGHLYVSGTKIGRVFQNTATLGQLPQGRHTVRVTLNTNNHVAYMKDGAVISAETVIEVD